MKRLILLIWIMLPVVAAAQDTEDVVPTDSIVKTWDLERVAWRAWQPIDSAWMDSIYWNTLRKHKIHMDCGHCTRVIMHVDMKIDSLGKLEQYRVESSHICDDKMQKTLEKEFMEYFFNLTFPLPLRSRVIRTQLGTGLKC